MSTINEIEDRLNAVAFSGRSYPGSSREEVTAAYNAAVADFEANAAVDIAYLIARVRELEKAIVVAAAGVADAASNVATRFASSHHEARMIRLAVGEPIEVLVNVSQGTATMSEEDER